MSPDSTPEAKVDRRVSRTQAMLQEQGQKLGCAAIALLSDAGAIRRAWARSGASRAFGKEQFKALGNLMIARCVALREPVASHRVRAAQDEPPVAQLIALPVALPGERPVAILAALWRPTDPPFRKAAQRALQQCADAFAKRMPADRDGATGLLTWSGFCRRMDRLLSIEDAHTTTSILYGNIDRLHLLNVEKGMPAGDAAIVHAGLVIREEVSKVRHIACRLSGDRFVVALPDQDLAAARDIAERIRAAFAAEAQRRLGIGTSLSLSFGVVAGATRRSDIDRALTEAELACRAAKDRGRNRVETFEQSDVSMIRRHGDMDAVSLLRDALEMDGLIIFAQPIVPLLNLQLPRSYELLVRIAAQDGRIVEPPEFMSAAARYQMLPTLDRAIIVKALNQLRAAAPHQERLPFNVSINVSATTLATSGFDDWLLNEIRLRSIPCNQLTLEITESTAASHLDNLQQSISGLTRAGVRFAIDDFGTGVNSLSHIKSLDIATIKLDGSYVRDLAENNRSQALVRAIVQLAEGMGMMTVAEYVDSVVLRTRLMELGVHFAQGFALGRPEPLANILAECKPLPEVPADRTA